MGVLTFYLDMVLNSLIDLEFDVFLLVPDRLNLLDPHLWEAENLLGCYLIGCCSLRRCVGHTVLVPNSAWKTELRKEFSRCLHELNFLLESLRLFFTQDPKLYCHWAKPDVAVFCSQMQPILRPRSEHPIWFRCPCNNQIINQCSCKGLRSVKYELRPTLSKLSRIDSGDDALTGRFFVASGTIDLTCKEETWQLFGL